MKVGLPLMKNVLTSLAKSVLIVLVSTAAASATDTAIQKKICGSGMTTLIISIKEMKITLIILIEEMKHIMKIVRSLKESGLLIKNISETIENEAKEQKGRFLSVMLSILVSGFQETY